ncbi:hypothetical protein IW261DRAFT_1556638 [Armillaria novae-zelandiae]|uniref:DUF6535 domain-containing protein n=1 Tax=Armillaria novae-zelandiae TaxID=153914 RepID=A0AA39PXD2_9AGAR|nr:hypothetical protein IW261DRAFT_1556638 [Armillaria novae-zelandiae]
MDRAQPTAKKGNDPYNCEDRFPEDLMYEETTLNARVWMTRDDANMVEEIRDNVDVLLVFAGLFSAVFTVLIVQTFQNLQIGYAHVSASLLFELLLVQRAIANGSPVETVPISSLNPQTALVPAVTDVWVNGLWFASLFLSLTTALVTVLMKQWLHHYVVLPPRERCFLRQYRYLGFQKCVSCYLSVLGKPLTLKEGDLESNQCWFNRAWTLQGVGKKRIICDQTLDGPMQTKGDKNRVYESKILTRFHQKLRDASAVLQYQEADVFRALVEMQHRKSTKKVDEVMGLAFLLRASTIPAHCESQNLETAWIALVNTTSKRTRAILFFHYPEQS